MSTGAQRSQNESAPVAQGMHEAPLYPPTVVPPSEPLPLGRFLVEFVRNPIAVLPRAAYEEPIVVHDNGRSVMAWVSDPALVEQVLLHASETFPKTPIEKRVFARTLGDGILTSQGASWRWQRRIAAPLFRPSDLAALVPAMVDAAEHQIAEWRSAPPGAWLPIDRAMTETTFRVISTTMFAGGALSEAETILKAAKVTLDTVSWEIAAAILRVPEWMWHPGKLQRRLAARRLRGAVTAILERRRSAGLEGNDLLARLAKAQDPDTGTPMAEKQLVDNLITFLAAGHETTAKALTWSLYLLARAPEWQRRIFAEVRSLVGDRPLAAEHLDRLPVTRAVLKEAMRLYPPAPVMSRLATERTALGSRTIEPGTLAVIPIFAIHRHRKLWDDPGRFDPERFMPEREAGYARTQFMPFGFGPRTCIGMSFAMMEGIAILATLVQRARFEWDGEHLPEPVSRVTLRPKGGMPLRVWLWDDPR